MGPGIGLTGVGKKLAKPFVPLFSWLWGRKLTEGSSKGDEIGTKIQVRKKYDHGTLEKLPTFAHQI